MCVARVYEWGVGGGWGRAAQQGVLFQAGEGNRGLLLPTWAERLNLGWCGALSYIACLLIHLPGLHFLVQAFRRDLVNIAKTTLSSKILTQGARLPLIWFLLWAGGWCVRRLAGCPAGVCTRGVPPFCCPPCCSEEPLW